MQGFGTLARNEEKASRECYPRRPFQKKDVWGSEAAMKILASFINVKSAYMTASSACLSPCCLLSIIKMGGPPPIDLLYSILCPSTRVKHFTSKLNVNTFEYTGCSKVLPAEIIHGQDCTRVTLSVSPTLPQFDMRSFPKVKLVT